MAAPTTASSAAGHQESAADEDSQFTCNICLEQPTDPVITLCGHLFCWSCLYRVRESTSLMLRRRPAAFFRAYFPRREPRGPSWAAWSDELIAVLLSHISTPCSCVEFCFAVMVNVLASCLRSGWRVDHRAYARVARRASRKRMSSRSMEEGARRQTQEERLRRKMARASRGGPGRSALSRRRRDSG